MGESVQVASEQQVGAQCSSERLVLQGFLEDPGWAGWERVLRRGYGRQMAIVA